MLVLSHDDLRTLLNMKDVIEAVESGFLALGCSMALAPERLHLNIPTENGVLLEMPSFMGRGHRGGPALGTKIVSVFEGNLARGLDIVQSAYLLLDAETGEPLSLMDGKFITGIRTAATSAVATKFMASPGPKQVAIFGAGVQARFHVAAMVEVAAVDRIIVVSRNEENARELALYAASRFAIPSKTGSAAEAARTSDLICTCTSSGEPIFDGRLIKQGAHINSVGAFTPSTRELDGEAVRRARLIIDDESAAGREAGEILIPLAEGLIGPGHVRGTLAEVVSGKVAGRESVDEITLFKSCGLAIEDLVTARLAYDSAKARNIGAEVSL
jgi:ornithine cyclodeaminase/alanine dehydrogenase